MSKEVNCFTEKNSGQRELDYRTVVFTPKETIIYLAIIGVIVGGIAFLFYRSLWMMIPLSAIGIYLWRDFKKIEVEKRQDMLASQFKDCIRCVSAGMRAGYSVENAFRESIGDINLIYGENSYMSRELKNISIGLTNNENLEDMLVSLGNRSGVDDIREFGEIFRIAKRGGGNLTGIISDTVALMERKMEIDREIKVVISSKKLESRIMEVVPFGIIAYLSVTSPTLFENLYHNFVGITVMSVCLIVYVAAFLMSKRIVSIEV